MLRLGGKLFYVGYETNKEEPMKVSTYAGGYNRFFDGIGIDTGVLEELRCTMALARWYESDGDHDKADEKFRELTAQIRLVRVYHRGCLTESGISEMLEQLEDEIEEHGVEWALTKPEFRS